MTLFQTVMLVGYVLVAFAVIICIGAFDKWEVESPENALVKAVVWPVTLAVVLLLVAMFFGRQIGKKWRQ